MNMELALQVLRNANNTPPKKPMYNIAHIAHPSSSMNFSALQVNVQWSPLPHHERALRAMPSLLARRQLKIEMVH